jgi:hypothetical protein
MIFDGAREKQEEVVGMTKVCVANFGASSAPATKVWWMG